MRGARNDRASRIKEPRQANRNADRSRSPRRGPSQRRSDGGNDRMVYIINLAYETRWVELKTLVQDKGGEVKFVEILHDRDGKSKGSAVVEFQTRESALACVRNLDRFEYQGRKLVVKEIRDPVAFLRKVKEDSGIDLLGGGGDRPTETERPQRTGTYDLFGLSPDFLRKYNIEPPLCDRVFIANLSFNVGTGRVYDIFGLAGKVVWMDLHMDKEQRLKGTGLIQYSHPIEAVQAISMFNGQRLYDRTLAVKMDRFDKQDKPSMENGLPRGLESIGMGLGADGAPLKDVASVVATMSRSGGLAPPPANPQQFGGNAGFNTMGAVGGSASFDRPMFESNFDRPSYDRGAMKADVPLYASSNQMSFGANPTPFGSGFGDTSANTMAYRTSGAVIIKNLPTDYTWQIVRDRVQQFGETELVDIVGPGCARIRFRNPQDAERLRTTLAGTSVEGRPITVELV